MSKETFENRYQYLCKARNSLGFPGKKENSLLIMEVWKHAIHQREGMNMWNKEIKGTGSTGKTAAV